MEIKISQSYIDKRIEEERQWQQNTAAGRKTAKECTIGLGYCDYNKDGKTSAIEMYRDIKDTFASVFAGNEKFSAEAEKIALAQGELYAKYAGEDGILDEAEYNACLQSKENSALLEQYWELADAMEAMKGEETRGLSRYDVNGDDNVSPIEIYKNKADLYNNVFNDNKEAEERAKNIALTQSEILSKYAGNDGVLSEEEYAEALRSEAYGKTMEEYLELKNIFSGITIKDTEK